MKKIRPTELKRQRKPVNRAIQKMTRLGKVVLALVSVSNIYNKDSDIHSHRLGTNKENVVKI